MFKNYISFYFTTFRRNVLKNLINILCLTIGITGFIVLFSFTRHELTYESNTPNNKNLYRIVTDVKQQEGFMRTSLSSSYIAKTVAPSIPEIVSATRITPSIETFLTIEDRNFYEENVWYADSAFFDVFKFPLLQGNPKEVLNTPFSIVLSQSMSDKYFANQNPIGKKIRIGDRWDYTVSGIMADIPSNTHLGLNILMTADSIRAFNRTMPGALSLYTYVLASESTSKDVLVDKIMNFFEEDYGEKWLELVRFNLQPIKDIHLKSDRLHEFANTGDSNQIYLLLIVAVLILSISIGNYINIMTAHSEHRSREAGIRKVAGASNQSLLFQFYMESFLNTVIAGVISLISIYYFWPIFCDFIELSLPFPLFINWHWFILFLFAIAFFSGSYPALVFSNIKPIKGIQFYIYNKKNKTNTRKILVIGQFALAVFVVFSTLVIYFQLEFVLKKDKGLDEENIAMLTLRDAQMIDQMDYLKNRLLEIPEIESVCTGGSRLTNIVSGQRSYALKDSSADFTGADFMIRTTHIDEKFIPLHKMEIVAGRNFDPINATDTSIAAIVNEAAVKSFGLANPIGVEINDNNRHRTLKIIGVVKDFHYQSMHKKIEPLIFRFYDGNLPFVYVKFKNNSSEAIKKIEDIWNELTGVFPFQMLNLSDEFSKMHKDEYKMRSLYLIFTVLALIIAALGLYGLTTHITEKRTKEIGIRKVLGAKAYRIFYVLSKDYFIWVFIANIISLPFAFIAINKWLQGFAYIQGIQWWVFILTILATCSIAFLTIVFVLYKAIRTRPIKCLKYE